MVLTYSWIEAPSTVLFADKCPVSLVKRTITLRLTLGIELQYTSLHELQLHVWLEIKWQYFQLASVVFRFEIQQMISQQLCICKYLISIMYLCRL